jgi:hypothetical protein
MFGGGIIIIIIIIIINLSMAQHHLVGLGLLIVEASHSHSVRPTTLRRTALDE